MRHHTLRRFPSPDCSTNKIKNSSRHNKWKTSINTRKDHNIKKRLPPLPPFWVSHLRSHPAARRRNPRARRALPFRPGPQTAPPLLFLRLDCRPCDPPGPRVRAAASSLSRYRVFFSCGVVMGWGFRFLEGGGGRAYVGVAVEV